jgi:hypothetical protein
MSGSKLSNPARNENEAPLGLTVHDMPAPGELAQADANRTRMGRLKMLMVLLICAAPVIASYSLYYLGRPDTRQTTGELIEPVREMPDWQVRDLQGREVALRSLRQQWLLVAVADAACDAVCEQNLYFQRQLREGLGKEKERLDRVWLVSDDAPVREQLLPALAQASVLRVPREQLEKWLQPAAGQALSAHLYVVDPMGRWMMRLPAGMDTPKASQARRDLERLLRASASWDTPGR